MRLKRPVLLATRTKTCFLYVHEQLGLQTIQYSEIEYMYLHIDQVYICKNIPTASIHMNKMGSGSISAIHLSLQNSGFHYPVYYHLFPWTCFMFPSTSVVPMVWPPKPLCLLILDSFRMQNLVLFSICIHWLTSARTIDSKTSGIWVTNKCHFPI